MKKLVFIVLISFAALHLFSQNAELAVDFSRYGTPITGPGYIDRSVVNELIHELERVNRSKNLEELNEAILKNVEGTPFMDNQFLKGEVLTVDGKDINDVLLRYNVYNNKMEAKFNESFFELSEKLITRVKIDNRTFDYLPYQIAKKEYSGYLELIHDGELKLYCRHSKKFKGAQPQKAMQDRPDPAEFRDLPLVYLLMKNDDSKATGFRSKKELLNNFTGHKNEIQAYIKNNKLKHNNSEDLKKLLNYNDTL